MKKIIMYLFCILSLLNISQKSKAQSLLGFSIGLTNNYLQTNISNQLNSEIGYYFSVPFHLKLDDKFSFSTDFCILQKSYSINRTGIYSAIYQKHINNYFQLPITLDYSILHKKKISLLLEGGGYIAYWYCGKVKGNIPNIFSAKDSINSSGQIIEIYSMVNYSQKYIFNSQTDNRIEFGTICRMVLHYQLINKQSITLSVQYYQSLTDQQKKYTINEIPKYNQTFVLNLGYLFSLDKLFHREQ